MLKAVKKMNVKIDMLNELKQNYIRAKVRINLLKTWKKIHTALSSDDTVDFTRDDAYLVIAFLMRLGLIRFFSRRKNKGQNNHIDFGVDLKVLSAFNYRYYIERHTTYNVIHDETLIKLINSLDSYIKRISSTIGIISKPSTYGLEEVTRIKFQNPFLNLVYLLAEIMEEVNNGNYGTSLIIDAIQNHLKSATARKKPLTQILINKFIKSKQNVISETEQEKIEDAKLVVIPEIELPDIRPKHPTRKYQWSGVNWILEAKRGVLAFDVGLGKTRIMILATYIAKQKGLASGAIIFTLKNVVSDFVREIKKVWPNAKIAILTGNKDQREKMYSQAMNADFIITTYGPLLRDMPEVDEIFNDRPDMMIFFDEGSRLKNNNTNTRIKAEQLVENRKFVIIADATPTPNDILIESFNLVNFCRPGQLGTLRAWKKKYGEIVALHPENPNSIGVYKHIDKIQNAISPFIYVKKRNDPDVNVDMPPEPNKIDKYFDMGYKQREYYERIEAETLDAVIDTMIPGNANFKNPKHIFTKIVRQRQVAITPWLIDKAYMADEVRLELAADIVKKWLLNEDSPIVIGSEFVGYYPRLQQYIIQHMKDTNIQLNEDLVQIFTGQTSAKKSEEIKRRLNDGTIKVALMGYKSAGAGINIQEKAHRVLLIHKPWNPALVEQFVGRVNRNGQKNQVDIISLLAADTIDEYIETKLLRKSYEADKLLQGQAKGDSDMAIKKLVNIAGFSIEDILKRATQRGATIDNSIVEEIGATDED